MTNTNELTAKLKAAAIEAQPANERLSVLPPDDIFDISLVEGEQLDRDITVMNSFNETANPANILALTEALEAAEKRIAAMQGLRAQLCANADLDIAALRQRIAELEARKLTVKLPDYVDGHTLGYGEVNHMIDLCADAIEKACHRDGIKLQIEGE